MRLGIKKTNGNGDEHDRARLTDGERHMETIQSSTKKLPISVSSKVGRSTSTPS